MRFLAILIFIIAFDARAQDMRVPKEYVKEATSIDEVENAAHVAAEKWTRRIMALDHVTNDGRKLVVDSTLRAQLLKSKGGYSFVDDEDWKKVKSLYRKGDVLYKFAWPPLSGPFGYVLIRENQQVVAIVTGYQ